jgi:hypothetical protein
MTKVRDGLLNTLWRGRDPFLDYPSRLYRPDQQGWGSQHHYLTEAIETLRPSIVVEIGAWKGASVIYLASRMKEIGLDGVVVAVDTWLGAWDHWISDEWFGHLNLSHGYPSLYHTFATNVIDEGLQDYVLPLPLDSINAANVLRHHQIAPDVVHVDGGHDYHAVTSDLREWWPMIRPRGILIGDDYPHWPEVKRAFDDYFAGLSMSPLEFEAPKCRIFK